MISMISHLALTLKEFSWKHRGEQQALTLSCLVNKTDIRICSRRRGEYTKGCHFTGMWQLVPSRLTKSDTPVQPGSQAHVVPLMHCPCAEQVSATENISWESVSLPIVQPMPLLEMSAVFGFSFGFNWYDLWIFSSVEVKRPVCLLRCGCSAFKLVKEYRRMLVSYYLVPLLPTVASY